MAIANGNGVAVGATAVLQRSGLPQLSRRKQHVAALPTKTASQKMTVAAWPTTIVS